MSGTARSSPELPSSAEVVIVGGGIVGASVADHLRQQGWQDIVLVEQGPLWETGGSTSHAPGLVFQLSPSRAVTQLAKWSVELYAGLTLDELPSYFQVGSVEVATTPERLAELDRRLGRAMAYELEARLLTPDLVSEYVPLIDAQTVLGGLYVASDGIAKAVRISEALARRAGPSLQLRAGCRVTGLQVGNGRIRAVETSHGTIAAKHVVVCAGIWGPLITRMAGVDLPLIPTAHQHAWTEPLPQLAGETGEVQHALLRHQDHGMYFRQRADRYGIGSYRHEPLPVEPDRLAPSGPGQRPAELAFTPEHFASAQREAGRILPPLAGVPLVEPFNGVFSFTPDGLPILGESGAVRGLWLAEAIWVTHAAGAGRVVAQLMTDGEAELDVHEFHPERFDAYGRSRSFARCRGVQQYREVYDVVHPREPVQVGRGLRRSPFFHRHQELGATFFEAAGWERPQWLAANADVVAEPAPRRSEWAARHWSPIAVREHVACRERAGLFDLTSFTKLRVDGPGAVEFLQWIAANDIDRPPGKVVYTSLLTRRGCIKCDLTITRLTDESFLVLTGGALGRHDLAWLRDHLPSDGSVSLHDESSASCALGLWGPLAREVLAPITEGDLSNEAFPYMSSRELFIASIPVRALRISYVGELGWELYAPTEFGLALWDAIWDAGRPAGLAACGMAAYDTLRLEKGYRLWGADIDEEHDPYEAGLDFAVKLDKGDFLGRSALLQRSTAVHRRLSCLVLDDDEVALLGRELIASENGDCIGYVTSAGWGATVRESIAYGYLPTELAEPGTEVRIRTDGRWHVARVTAEPLFDADMHRLRDLAAVAEG